MLSLKEAELVKKIKGLYQPAHCLSFSFLFSVCGLLFSALLVATSVSLCLGVSSQLSTTLVLVLLLLSTVLSSWIIQKTCCRVKAVDTGTEWLAVVEQMINQGNRSNRYLDWFFRHMLDTKRAFTESEAITRITDSLVSSTIAPWYSSIGSNEAFSQESCLAVEQALLNFSRLVTDLDMTSLLTDLTLITHRHIKKKAMCELTGSEFHAEHPVSLGKTTLEHYLDTQVTILMAAILPQYVEDESCLPVKLVKQVIRRMLLGKFSILSLNFGKEFENKENKEAGTKRLSRFM